MIKNLLTSLLLLSTLTAYCGDVPNYCATQQQNRRAVGGSAAKNTSAASEEDEYDVQYLKFNIALTNTNTTVSGDVTTRAKVVAASMTTYAFELTDAITVDSILVNNQKIAVFTTTGLIRKATLPAALTMGSVFTAQVFYHGQPRAGTGFFDGGLNHQVVNGTFHMMYSMSDKDLASEWWPSKQNIQDKIDSVDMWVTTDAGLKVGSNGLLMNTTNLPAGKVRYEWKTRYAIDYYLISVAVAPYNEYSYYMHFTDGSNDSMLIQNYYYNNSPLTAAQKAVLDTTGLIVDHFSYLFGRYPFDKEKYGHSFTELSGGMEHQTMTTMGTLAFYNITIVAHELGHQWFGDHVTYGTWRDIWLSEGFASYCEQLFIQKFYGARIDSFYRLQVFNRVLSQAGGSVYVDDTTDVNRIFSSRLTYDKGASVVSMLRYMAPQDSLFFKALKIYQSQYAFGNAYSKDLQSITEQVYGIKLDSFFNQWVYGQGYPIYNTKWYQQDGKLVIQLTQSTSMTSSVPCFFMPVRFRLKSATGDKVITLYNNANKQTFVVDEHDVITAIEIDPGSNILKKATPPVQDQSVLGITTMALDAVEAYPNPASEEWYVRNIPANTHCTLTDITGRVVWAKDCNGSVVIPARQLSRAAYLLTLTVDGNTPKYLKLVK